MQGNQSKPIQTATVRGSGAIAAYRAVTYAGAQATVQGEKVRGVAQIAIEDGELGAIDTMGETIIESGAAINPGDSLIVDAQGRAIPATGNLSIAAGATAVTSTAANGSILTGADLPEFVFADAIGAATAAGEFPKIKLR